MAEPDLPPVRLRYQAELDQVRLQVELMFVRVDENLERMREVLQSGDEPTAEAARRADDEIDAMNVSLTERCYTVLGLEAPVASDLRFVVSVIRVLNELERIGDLALRVVALAPHHSLLVEHGRSYDILLGMADEAVQQYRHAMRAWAACDLAVANEVAAGSRVMDVHVDQLMSALLALRGPDAIPVALQSFYAGRSLDRIADHAAIIGARVRYLVTGEPQDLIAEVR